MKISFRKALLIYTLIPITIIFVVFAVENLINTKNESRSHIERHMTDLAISYANIFNGFLKPIEGAAKTNAGMLEINPEVTEEEIYRMLELQVQNNPIVYGAAIAFMPNQFDKKRRLFAPYIYRKKGNLNRLDIGQSGYDYTDPEWEWWNYTATTGKAHWTEPYFDEGAGNILMSTYSVPFYRDGDLWGVATVDIPLHEISKKIQIPGVKGQEISVLSPTGMIILFPDQHEIGESIFDFVDRGYRDALENRSEESIEDLEKTRTNLIATIKAMLAGETGVIDLTTFKDKSYLYFFSPIRTARWSFSIRVKESEIFKRVYERFWYSLLFFGFLLIFIVTAVFLVSGRFSRALEWLIDRCHRIERLDFQTADDVHLNINEIIKMSNTLNTMAQALNSHFSIKEDTRIAKAIRQQALPLELPDLSGFEFGIWSQPGEAGCAEIYDVIASSFSGTSLQNSLKQKPDSITMLLLDDADNGIDGTIKNIQCRAIFRTQVRQGEDLEQIASRMNEYLYADSALNGPVQSWLGVLNASSATFTSLTLGHHVVIHYSVEKNSFEFLPATDYSLSIQKSLPKVQVQIMNLAVGDIAIILSDGVVGALNRSREQYGTLRVQNMIQKHKVENAGDILAAIKQDYAEFTEASSVQTECSIIIVKRINSSVLEST